MRPWTSLHLSGIAVPGRLGWEQPERTQPQPVTVDLVLRFPAPPRACATDELSDTVDYAALVHRIISRSATGEYRLLERLARVLHDAVREGLPRGVQFRAAE